MGFVVVHLNNYEATIHMTFIKYYLKEVRASPRALQTNFALPYLQKRVENTSPMVLQIRFAIWLTLRIEVEALHICKSSHHFASTISAFHVGFRPPTPHDFSTPVHPPCRARPPSLPRAGTEVDLPSRGPSLGGGRRWMEPN